MSEKEIVIPISKIKTKEEKLELEPISDDSVKFTVKDLKDEIRVLKEGYISVKFSKFLNLAAMHDFDSLLELHKEDEVIISSDLLLDLASSSGFSEEPVQSQFSFIFLGIVLGLVVGTIIFLIFLK